MSKLVKPSCFSEYDWSVYKQDLRERTGTKYLDVCFDCTRSYQKQMIAKGLCDFPEKRLGNLTEFA